MMTLCVDADHAHDKMMRRLVTGVIMLINNMPIKWMSKRQKTVKTSTYGSKLVAARIAVDLVIEYRHTLRMLGTPVVGPALMLGNNKSVMLNTSTPSSMLKKKHLSIAYRRVREAIAARACSFAHVSSESNLSDCLTKPLCNIKFHNCVKPLLFRQPSTRGLLTRAKRAIKSLTSG